MRRGVFLHLLARGLVVLAGTARRIAQLCVPDPPRQRAVGHLQSSLAGQQFLHAHPVPCARLKASSSLAKTAASQGSDGVRSPAFSRRMRRTALRDSFKSRLISRRLWPCALRSFTPLRISIGIMLAQPLDVVLQAFEVHLRAIDWQTYEANQTRLAQNTRPGPHNGPRTTGGAVREGSALLQGLASCGHCGRRLQTHYTGRKSGPGYHCPGKVLVEGRGGYCLSIVPARHITSRHAWLACRSWHPRPTRFHAVLHPAHLRGP